jgi:hypothetical protein
MKWIVVVLILVLAGCGGGAVDSGNVGGTTSSPEQVHAAWVAAMQTGDRAAALSLVAGIDSKTAFVDGELRRMQDTLRAAKDGPLEQVTFQPVVDEGSGKLGVSVWHFARRPVCYGTSLVESDGGWKVSSWGIVVAACKGVT